MSPACLRVLTVFCICVSATLCSNVVWKNTGESITIQCKYKSEADSISLKKGLKKDQDIFFKSKKSLKINYADETRHQMHENGAFPNFDIILKNLTKNDTGVYWCMSAKINRDTGVVVDSDGEGSVLLVVTDSIAEVDKSTAANRPCNPAPNQNLVVISVVISAAVLLVFIIALLLWVIRKVKYQRVENKPRPAPAVNDVYEDMRGTIRR